MRFISKAGIKKSRSLISEDFDPSLSAIPDSISDVSTRKFAHVPETKRHALSKEWPFCKQMFSFRRYCTIFNKQRDK